MPLVSRTGLRRAARGVDPTRQQFHSDLNRVAAETPGATGMDRLLTGTPGYEAWKARQGTLTEQIGDVDTERLIAAYQGMRNPFDLSRRLTEGHQQDLANVLRSRGVDVDALSVTPGGHVNQAGRALGRFLTGAGILAGGGALAGALGAGALGAGAASGAAAPGASIPIGAGAAVPAVATGGGSLLKRLGQGLLKDPLKAAKIGLGVVGAVQGSQAAGRAAEYQRKALEGLDTANPFASLPADPGNPYSRPAGERRGQQALIRHLSR